MTNSNKIKLVLFLAVSAVILLLSLSLGASIISPFYVIKCIFGQMQSSEYEIIIKLRLPRVLMALIIGASLASSGTLFQALLKNPLSDPYTIGVSGGAAFGATIAIVLSLQNLFIVLLAFAGSLIVILIVYLLSKRIRLGTTTLILSGIALSFILSSGVMLLFSISNAEKVHKAVFWLMGDLSLARYDMLWKMAVISLLIILLSLYYSKHLNLISFGDSFARNLGVSSADIKNIFWIASFLAAISVSLAGVIGFVGLVVPHAMRTILGPDHRVLLPAAAAGGGLFLIMSDTIGRCIVPPYEIPVGIITGFLGGIFFLILLIKKGGIK